MDEKKYIDRWKLILEVLNAMVKGDFSTRISRSAEKDRLEESVEIINMRLQEIDAYLRRLAYIHPDKTYLILTEMSITLDDKFRVLRATTPTSKLLNISLADLKGKPLKSLLISSCLNNWEEMEETLKAGNWERGRVEVTFKKGEGLEMPVHATIAPLGPGKSISYIFNTHVTFIYEEDFKDLLLWAETLEPQNDRIRSANIRLAEQVQNYLKKKLRDAKIDLDILSIELGTTTKRINKAFKEQFGLTPLQYHREERLLRLKELIEDGELSLTQIRLNYGFTSKANFFKQIKKRFNKTPGALKSSAAKMKHHSKINKP